MADDDNSAERRIQVTVISPLPAVRTGLRAMLADDQDLEVRAFTSLAWEGASERSGVTVVDLQDPAAELSAFDDAIGAAPAVFLAAASSEFDRDDMHGPGRAYLLNDTTAEELQAAVRAVAAGLVVFAPGVLPAPGEARAARHAAPIEGLSPLTDRELQVLRLMGDGLPNKAIALRLGITEHTVKFHVGAILGKLAANSRTEAVTIAVRSGVLPL